jgi:prolyl-tRNA editing enzyme YbaK/EbsC (Cys-tRNA(Pro) deacylase)
MNELSPSAKRVQDALEEKGYSIQVVELPDSTRTAEEAAKAVGGHVGQIVKSLIFKTKRSRQAVLVLASGVNRVDERKIEELINEPLGKADASFVRQETGFAIGGVSPLGLKHPIPTFIDEDLLNYETVWAAAGTPHAVFQIHSADLPQATSGKVCDIKKDK